MSEESLSLVTSPIMELGEDHLKTLNVYQRLNLVREQIEYIKKTAKVQGYSAVTHDAVTGALRDHLVAAGIIVVPEEISSTMIDTGTTTAKGIPFMRFEALYKITFVNIDNPEDKVSVQLTAHAIDQGDKAPGKAISYAVKYAFLKLFSLETGEDDEAREAQKAKQEPTFDLHQTIRLGRAIERHWNTIQAIKDGILTANLSAAAEAWFEMDNDEKRSIWAAPTKGGPFTASERDIIKSKEFRVAYYGEEIPEEDKENVAPTGEE